MFCVPISTVYHRTLIPYHVIRHRMSESAGNWITCPDCGSKFFAIETDDGTECDQCGAAI